MPLDTLQTLLQKAHAIKINIQQHITHLQDRKGKQVITKHQYTLQTKLPDSKKQKTQYDTPHPSDAYLLQISDKTSTVNADDIIAAWEYGGKPLKKEKIAIDEFIDRDLDDFDDLIRLNDEYSVLLDKYTR